MFHNRLYYRIKPIVPWAIRMKVRRWFAVRKRSRFRHIWPVSPGSETPPENWGGWPEGKRFGLVLTHDVEGRTGLERCVELMRLEMQFGFRSCFNFIPEGDYRVPGRLIHELEHNGFEVGVHDLYHDGQLFSSRSVFRDRAVRINQYLKSWGAVGFRSGFMLNELDWLHDLNIEYDCSTFDTDPFEPQPQGRNTIFPFWVPNPNRTANLTRPGYVELPYTLPQDSTLFLLFRERSIDIWRKKLGWIAKHGGMVLLDTHPDYSSFNGSGKTSEYPISLYKELLQHIHSEYFGSYWHALPREAAAFVRNSTLADGSHVRRWRPGSTKLKSRIWIDLDNTPHVPFFEPILEELRARDFPLLVTARDAFQVCDLADKKRLQYIKVGRHHGKHRLAKAAGLAYRSLQLAPLVLKERPALGVSHGARSQLLLSTWLGIPTLLIEDYEHSEFPLMMRPTWVMAPAVIPDQLLWCKNGNIRKYSGIKEDVYAWKLKPDSSVLTQLGLGEADLIVTVRPPATEAHYHNPESEKLFESFMDRACHHPEVRVVLLPRNDRQARLVRCQWPKWFDHNKTVIPRGALDGLNLIWNSDLVVSGGGTMNREAAALGVPVYSIFRGNVGAVDRHLSEKGRLVLIESVADVSAKIHLVRRQRHPVADVTSRSTLHLIVDTIEEIAEKHARRI